MEFCLRTEFSPYIIYIASPALPPFIFPPTALHFRIHFDTVSSIIHRFTGLFIKKSRTYNTKTIFSSHFRKTSAPNFHFTHLSRAPWSHPFRSDLFLLFLLCNIYKFWHKFSTPWHFAQIFKTGYFYSIFNQNKHFFTNRNKKIPTVGRPSRSLIN